MPSATSFSKDQAFFSTASTPGKHIAPSPSYFERYASPPTPQLCAQMNADIRANPALDSPYFDLAGHIGSRAYCMDNIYHDGPDDTATLLDVGVQALLPTPIPAPPNRTPKGPTFDIRQSEGKRGLGMFAAQNIPAGGLIVVERPVLVVPYIIAIQTYTESELYAALLGRLSPDTVARFLVLSNCKPASECDAVEGIMRTNAIGITLEVPDGPHPELPTHRAIFLNVSRCNHSCGPNAVWHWDATSFSLSLEALRPIEAGQEITVAYITPTHSRAERRARPLNIPSSSGSRCEFCARPAIAVSKSDAMRAELRAFWDAVPSFEAWCLDARMPDHALIDAHKRAILLIEAEGLQTLDYGKHLDAIAMGYGALQDVEQFRAWMWHARDARPVGRDDAARVMQKWINDPESFPVWGWRKSLQRRRKD